MAGGGPGPPAPSRSRGEAAPGGCRVGMRPLGSCSRPPDRGRSFPSPCLSVCPPLVFLPTPVGSNSQAGWGQRWLAQRVPFERPPLLVWGQWPPSHCPPDRPVPVASEPRARPDRGVSQAWDATGPLPFTSDKSWACGTGEVGLIPVLVEPTGLGEAASKSGSSGDAESALREKGAVFAGVDL